MCIIIASQYIYLVHDGIFKIFHSLSACCEEFLLHKCTLLFILSYSLEHALNVVSQSSNTLLTSATKTTPTSRQVAAHSPYTPGRSSSQSSSHSTITPSPTQSPRKTDDLNLSMEAIKDLKKMVATVTDTYKKVSNGQTDYLNVDSRISEFFLL